MSCVSGRIVGGARNDPPPLGVCQSGFGPGSGFSGFLAKLIGFIAAVAGVVLFIAAIGCALDNGLSWVWDLLALALIAVTIWVLVIVIVIVVVGFVKAVLIYFRPIPAQAKAEDGSVGQRA